MEFTPNGVKWASILMTRLSGDYTPGLHRWHLESLAWAAENGALTQGYRTKEGEIHKKTAAFLIEKGLLERDGEKRFVLTKLGKDLIELFKELP